MNRVSQLVTLLALQPHPEGGFFAETYRSSEMVEKDHLPQRFKGSRNCSTAIYFLLPAGVFSAFHRILSDEVWHFYEGQALLIYVLTPEGTLEVIRLGTRLEEGEHFQAVVPAGCWFASIPAHDDGYSFVGCTVAPGFDYADFKMANREELVAAYPQHETIITALTRSC